MDHLSVGKRIGQRFQWLTHRGDVLQDLFSRYHRDIVLGEVNAGLEQRNQFHQFLLDGLQAAGECPFKLLGCHLGLVKSPRLDQIAYSLGLSEIDASLEEGAHGKFARFSDASAARQSKLNNVTQNHRRTVSRDFNDVVRSV